MASPKDYHSRKLVAIMQADVVGYSRLMGEDEAGTLSRLKTHREELIDPTIEAYHGRIVKLMGDGALVEFPSVVEAVACAVAVQNGMTNRNEGISVAQRIELRIGINLGDIIVEGDDIHGDGVNITARLESLAPPGGICISGVVYEAIGNKLPLEYESLGEQTVKNIAQPVRAYSARLLPGAVLPAPMANGKKKPRIHLPIVAAGVVVAAAVAGTLVWLQPWTPEFEPASVENMAYPLPERPSIAVLPLDNLSGDPEQDYLAAGLTENIITILSEVPDLFVIARHSTDTYKGKSVPVRQVAEEQGVRHVLEGSVQKSGDRIRINARLIDALEGDHLWAERYDRPYVDLFDLQDDITHNVAIALQVQLTRGEMGARRHREANPEAFLLAHKAAWYYQKFNKEDTARAGELARQAREIDPNGLFPLQMEGWVHYQQARFGWSASREESLRKAEEIADRASQIDDTDAYTHLLLASIARSRRNLDQAIRHVERAIETNPNHNGAIGVMALVLNYAGRPEEAIPYSRKAMRLTPFYPPWMPANLGLSYMMTGEYDEAIAAYEEVLARGAMKVFANERLAAIHALKGDLDKAKEYAAKLLEVKPDFSIEGWSKVLFYKKQEDLDHELNALRKAGLPEKLPLELPDRPSIAVLPFTNMSGDPEQEYFSDGISEDIITDLSRLSNLIVIARNSSFTYKSSPVKVQQVGQDLGVRYVLEGSVRKAGDRVRITAQLVDTTSGHHLWAERYDRKLTDIFALQDDITRQIVNALALHLSEDNKRDLERVATESFEAYDLFLRGLQTSAHFEGEALSRAVELYRQAIRLDPGYARAYGALGVARIRQYLIGYSDSPARTKDRALELVRKAESLDPTSHQIQWSLGYIHMYRNQFDEAEEAALRAVSLSPNYADGYALLALIKNNMGKADESISLLEKAMALNPYYTWDYVFQLGRAYYAKGQYDNAAPYLRDATERNPSAGYPRLFLAATYVNLGETEDAEWEINEIQMSHPEYTLSHVQKTYPIVDQKLMDRFLSDLRTAGLAE